MEKVYQPGEFYEYPLIIKKLLKTPLVYSPDREIIVMITGPYMIEFTVWQTGSSIWALKPAIPLPLSIMTAIAI